jgi:hypothetical protein
MGRRSGWLLAAALVMAASQAHAADYRAPRTHEGAPDFNGLWTNFSLTSLERPAGVDKLVLSEAESKTLEMRLADQRANPPGDAIGNRPSEWWQEAALARLYGGVRTSWIVSPADGKLPYTEEGRRRMAGRRFGTDNPEDRGTSDRCLTAGWGAMSAPMLNSAYSAIYQIVQTADTVAILSEMNHDVRLIRLGAKHPPKAVRYWMGDSVGHWEKDTLVVETTNFYSGEAFRTGYYVSPDGVVIERFTRISATQILYRFTIDDPATYTQPWTAEMPFNATKAPVFEFACHEGNYGLEGILAGARQEEIAKARLAQSAAP